MRKTLPSNRSDIQFEYRVRIDITRIVRPLSKWADIHLRIPNAGIPVQNTGVTVQVVLSLGNYTGHQIPSQRNV